MILHNRLQNKVAGSVATLPVCFALATILWWCQEREVSAAVALGWVLCMFTAYVTMETNNTFNLIRIRTRLTTSIWLLLVAAMPFTHHVRPALAALCLSCSYYVLFRCYQIQKPEQFIFHAFFFLGIGLFLTPIMLPIAVLFYIYLSGFLRSLTWKGFWAGLMGLATPAWCWFAWCLFSRSTDRFLAYFEESLVPELPSCSDLLSQPFPWYLSIGYTALLGLLGVANFYLTNYNDKIRTRMLLYIYCLQTLLCIVAVVLQPSDFPTLMSLLLVSACPLTAHYFALTGSWLSNTLFVLATLMFIAITYINTWMPSFSI